MLTRLSIVVFAALSVWLWMDHTPRGELPPLPMPTLQAARIVEGARAQIGDVYDARYQVIKYPGGDVKRGRGACTDVVIRAFRNADVDLQEGIHRDMMAHFAAYPHLWGLTAPNTDIDHRRVPNQMAFLRRHGHVLTTLVAPWTLKQWQPGDIVYWNTAGALGQQLHTGIVSNRRSGHGVPFVIHNGWRCIEENALTRWKIIGHFRLDDEPMS
jgi:hypothetical protein